MQEQENSAPCLCFAPCRLPRIRARGFTLLELLAVITIIAILAGIVIGVGRRASEAGKTARAKAELAVLAAALEAYRRAYGDYPRTDDESVLIQSLIGKRGPTGTELTAAGKSLLETARFTFRNAADPFGDATAALLDPWERAYVYVYKVPASGWSNSSFVLYSVGPDGLDTPALLTGGFPDVATAGNADNIHANR